jgi:hypothetical protein
MAIETVHVYQYTSLAKARQAQRLLLIELVSRKVGVRARQQQEQGDRLRSCWLSW